MKINSILFSVLTFFIIVFFVSCSNSASKDKEDDNQTEYINNTSSDSEDFKTFLENFNRMPTFQRQRVLFPLEATMECQQLKRELITKTGFYLTSRMIARIEPDKWIGMIKIFDYITTLR